MEGLWHSFCWCRSLRVHRSIGRESPSHAFHERMFHRARSLHFDISNLKQARDSALAEADNLNSADEAAALDRWRQKINPTLGCISGKICLESGLWSNKSGLIRNQECILRRKLFYHKKAGLDQTESICLKAGLWFKESSFIWKKACILKIKAKDYMKVSKALIKRENRSLIE